MENIILSIIIPVYNSTNTIDRCLESILKQDIEDYEIVLIDDGSTDSCKSYLDKNYGDNSKIIINHKVNRGVSSARNQGLDIAKGQYIMFVDSDDYLKDGMIKKYINQIETQQCDIVIGGFSLIKKDNISTKTMKYELLSNKQCWDLICKDFEVFGYVTAKLYKREIIVSNRIRFNENMNSQEDLDFNLEYYKCCKNLQMVDYADYCYDFVENKRKPRYLDYIKNQLKIVEYSSHLSDDAHSFVVKRINNLVYCYLYEAENYLEFKNRINSLCNIRGFNDFTNYFSKRNMLPLVLKILNLKLFFISYLTISTRKKLGKLRKMVK